MNCLLHIGTEKTGSTSLQYFFHKNAEALRDRGVYYSRSLGHPEHRRLVTLACGYEYTDWNWNFCGFRDEEGFAAFSKDLKKGLEAEISEIGSSDGTFVISSELFHSRVLEPEMVDRVHDLLAPMFETVEVLCFLRPQAEVALSLLSSLAKEGCRIRKESFNTDGIYYDYLELYRRWARRFENTCFVPYKRHPNIIEFVTEKLGQTMDGLQTITRANEKLDYRTIALLGAGGDIFVDGEINANREIFINEFSVESPVSVDRATAAAEQRKHQTANEELCRICPSIEPADLDVDLDKFPVNGNLADLDNFDPYAGWVNKLVVRFNVELNLANAEKYAAFAERALARRNLKNSEHFLNEAVGFLGRAAQARNSLVEPRIERLQKKLRRVREAVSRKQG